MPLRLEIKKKLSARSDRVKSVEIHPTEPWVLAALYNGNVFIWDYESGSLVKSFEVSDDNLPVRCAKWIPRKQWFVACSDDLKVRCYNYNTMEKVAEFEAHTDYIRYLEVHPSLPHVLSCSDDTTIKLWDWEKDWNCTKVFEGHAHYVMMVRFNPKDANTFASASLDRTVKGINCVDYYPGGDKPYLLSGSDDRTVKVWDYQTKACVQTLEGHTNNVVAVCFHPRLPVLLSGAEDGTVRLFNSATYRAETTLNYGLERVWTLSATQSTSEVAIGFDEGTIGNLAIHFTVTHLTAIVHICSQILATSSEQSLVGTAHWVGDCFLYTANGSRLNYYVGGQVMTLAHLAAPAYLLGYLPKEDRVFLGDKQGGFLSYQVNQAVLRYQTAIVRRDFAAANALLAEGRVPAAEYGAVARFLESQGFKEEALQVTPDPDQKFDLSIELGRADLALELLEAAGDADQGTTEYATKWKRLGDLALGKGDLALAQRCALASDDLSGLLLLCTSAGDLQGLAALAEKARALGRANVAFLALFLQGRVEECLDLLVEGKRHAEAAFLARTYLPSHVPRLVALWKEAVAPQSEKAAAALACPAEFPNLFEDFDVALQVEQLFLQNREQRFPASTWPEAKGQLDLDLIAFLKGQGGGGGGTAPPAEETAPPAPAAAEVNAPPPPGDGAAEEAQRPAEEQRAAE
ncbi:unnamed protein product, partial [Heterosigma akashiwo]